MVDSPPYPDKDREQGSASTRRGGAHLLWIIGGALLVLFIVLHLTGTIGPGSH